MVIPSSALSRWWMRTGKPTKAALLRAAGRTTQERNAEAREAEQDASLDHLRAPPNKPLKQTAAPLVALHCLPLARGEVPRARSCPPATSRFADAAAA